LLLIIRRCIFGQVLLFWVLGSEWFVFHLGFHEFLWFDNKSTLGKCSDGMFRSVLVSLCIWFVLWYCGTFNVLLKVTNNDNMTMLKVSIYYADH
jgi:hypothetical protein